MSMHSSGNWILTRMHKSPCSIEIEDDPSGMAIAKVYLTDPKTKKRTPEFEANARLMVAAPKLLAAAKALQEWAQMMGGWEAPAWIQLRAAIDATRETGEQS